MACVTQVQINESAETLEVLLRQQKNLRLKERIQALYLIKTEGMSVKAIAKILGRDSSTIQRWLADYQEGGITLVIKSQNSLLKVQKILNCTVENSDKQIKQSEGQIQRYNQLQQWFDSIFGVQAQDVTVYKLQAKLKMIYLHNRKQKKRKLKGFKKTFCDRDRLILPVDNNSCNQNKRLQNSLDVNLMERLWGYLK
ncbi:helix-turn-helix domain-containing protein [Chlorogloeopsis sp. ULAP02]|uniref:helix-turn-helix domain-containing protein n=1 Tax=Chlorogloeopsis sp. ULAP02 TaxID=3107926 RepID=UPI003134EE0E